MRWNSKDQEKRLKLQALTIQRATSKLGREVEGPDEVALAGGPRCTKHWQFGEIPSGFSGRLVMVVTVTRLEPGHCTAVSYDSHAWWGSCERPMSDVTSLVRCAQPQAPLAQPCHARVVSCRVPLKTHTQPTVLHGPWGAWHGPAWSGQAIPADALLGVSCWIRPVIRPRLLGF